MPERGGKVSIVVLVRKTKMPRKTLLGVLLCGLIVVVGFQRPDHPVRRVGMVIGIKPEKISAYKALHADSNSGVRDLLASTGETKPSYRPSHFAQVQFLSYYYPSLHQFHPQITKP